MRAQMLLAGALHWCDPIRLQYFQRKVFPNNVSHWRNVEWTELERELIVSSIYLGGGML